jgi:ubiquinone/menaquinone biosynthesis C-methylase UbiE
MCGSFLRTWEWPKLLGEYRRVTRRGGVIRITELEKIPESGSLALTRLSRLFTQAFYQAGHWFDQDHDGVACELERLLRQHGIQNVQTRPHILEYRAGTPEGQLFYEDMSRIFRTSVPFIRKWMKLPDDYDVIYQQALADMQQPDFVAQWAFLTAWGQAPGYYTDRRRFDTPR